MISYQILLVGNKNWIFFLHTYPKRIINRPITAHWGPPDSFASHCHNSVSLPRTFTWYADRVHFCSMRMYSCSRQSTSMMCHPSEHIISVFQCNTACCRLSVCFFVIIGQRATVLSRAFLYSKHALISWPCYITHKLEPTHNLYQAITSMYMFLY